MSVSPVDFWGRVVPYALALVLVVSVANAAGPLRLLPPGETVPDVRAPTARFGIAVSSLDEADKGVLNQNAGGFAPSLWTGINRVTAGRLLAALPNGGSPQRVALLERLLATAAAPPSGIDAVAFLETRTRLLLRAGRTATARAMALTVPPKQHSPALDQMVADSYFIDGRAQQACAAGARGFTVHNGSYWQKTAIVCHFLAGRRERALLLTEVLREQGDQDPVFTQIWEKFAGLALKTSTPVIDSQRLHPLEIAMLRAMPDFEPPDNFLEALEPWAVRAFALGGPEQSLLRQRAALMAAEIGALSTQELADLYATMPADDRLSLPLLYQRALREPSVQSVSSLLTAGRQAGAPVAVARLAAPLIADMRPDDKLEGFAGDAVRALLVAGKDKRAQQWVNAAHVVAAATDQSTTATVDDLRMVERVAGFSDATQDPPPPLALGLGANAAARAATLTATMDTAIMNALWWSPLWGKDHPTALAPSAATIYALRSAASQRQPAMTVVLALALVGDKPWPRVANIALAEALTALDAINKRETARQLALEALIASGL